MLYTQPIFQFYQLANTPFIQTFGFQNPILNPILWSLVLFLCSLSQFLSLSLSSTLVALKSKASLTTLLHLSDCVLMNIIGLM